MIKKYKIKMLTIVLISLMSFNSFVYKYNYKYDYVKSESILDLEELKRQNDVKINELEKSLTSAKNYLTSSEEDEISKKNYQDNLNQKIILQNQNIEYVQQQISDLGKNLADLNDEIAHLQIDINQKNVDVDKNMDVFKKRLRASYMTGNDEFASILVGAKDFYEVLSKMELVGRIAKHDKKLINELQQQISELNDLELELKQKSNSVLSKIEETEIKRKEFKDLLSQLSIEYQATQEELLKISNEQANITQVINQSNSQIEDAKKIQEELNSKIVKIQEQMRLEEEKKKKEEAERLKAETYKQPANPTKDFASGFSWPVPGFYAISSGYGYRAFDNAFHPAIDISGYGVDGSSIVAASSGTVIIGNTSRTHNYSKQYSCGCGGGYGNYLTIVHDSSTSTLYGHCQSIIVSDGQYVEKGQVIGYVGNTGMSTGSHLHFEVNKNGQKTNPMDLYS